MKKLLHLNRITSLLIFSVLLIIVFPLIFVFDRQSLQDTHGIGLIVSIITIIIGLIGILVDYLLFKLVKNKWILNLDELILITGLIYIAWPN